MRGSRRDNRLVTLFARQHGVITRKQALAFGLSERAIEYRVCTGAWQRVYRSTYIRAGTPLTTTTRSAAALLYCGPGAHLSHFSALHLLGLNQREPKHIWVTVPNSRRATLPGVIVTRTQYMPEYERFCEGLRVSTPARTLIDIARYSSLPELRNIVHEGIFRRRLIIEDLIYEAKRIRRVPGLALIHQLIAEFDPSADSGAEAEAGRLFRSRGWRFDQQHRVRLPSGRFAILDFAEPSLRLAIEIDGAAYHSSPTARERDRARDTGLIRLGWQVVRFTVWELRQHPEQVAGAIAEVIAKRREQLPQ